VGDRTNFELHVKDVPSPAVRKQIRDLFPEQSDHFLYTDSEDATSLELGANECDLNAANDMEERLRDLVKDGFEADCDVCDGEGTGENGSITLPCRACEGNGVRVYPVPDFRWMLSTDDYHEFPGDTIVHVPGVGDYSNSDGGDGTVASEKINNAVEAATDLDALKATLLGLTGRDVILAFSS
jgi:hypothetical protein